MKQSKQQLQQRAAAERREAKARAHAAMMVQHAERKLAIAQWEAAREAWYAADCIGPRVIHPDDVGSGSDMAAFRYDVAHDHFNAMEDDTADLVNAAAALGIDIAA